MKFDVKLKSKHQLSENVFVFDLDCPKLDFKSGQFITFILKDKENKPKPRSYSLLNPPNKDPQLLIELVPNGIAGETFRKATKDTVFQARGPLGKFFFQDNNKKHIFIATNTGLAPVHAMIAENINTDNNLTLIFGAKTKDRLYLHDKWTELNKKDNFTYLPIVSREDHNDIPKGHVQKIIPIDHDANYYICGNDKMVKDVIQLLSTAFIKNIYYEIF